MTVRKWPLALNQPGYDYPAEGFRAQHFGASAGGNGVVDPGALKVVAQPAPDGTVSILPGGAYVRSTYAGALGQSYYVSSFEPEVLTIPPTGSASGGRHDLLILRVCDPQYDQHPDHPGGEISEEEAADYDFWWFEIHQGRSANTTFDFPHVKLAHIRRGPNQTIVRPADIIDLRELANPQRDVHMRGNNMVSDDTQSLHTGSTVWPTDATHTYKIPEFATKFTVLVNWNNIRYAHTADIAGIVRLFIVHPDGSEISTQEQRWRKSYLNDRDRFELVLSDGNISIPEKFRGEDCRIELRGTKTAGPNVYMDGNSSWSLVMFFEQEIA